MGIFRKIRAAFHDDWCNLCQSEMDVVHKQLYALPDLTVDHYISHETADYYREHLVPVSKKSQIPPGMYACGLHAYRCPNCGHRRIKLTTFLPVRDQEKIEEILFFDHGELDGFLYQPKNCSPDLGQDSKACRQDSAGCKYSGPYDYE